MKSWNRYKSGLVVDGDWHSAVMDVETIPVLRQCRLHWQAGIPWEDTGLFDDYEGKLLRHGVVDGCANLDDVRRRYEELDRIFDEVRSQGRLRTRRELDEFPSFREQGAIYIHIGPECQPIFGGAGYHRFAIARILNLRIAPAQIGMVHPQALTRWKSKYLYPGGSPASQPAASSAPITRPGAHPW